MKKKIKALKIITEKYDRDMMEFFNLAIEKSLNRTNVYRFEIKEITGKIKRVKL